LKDIVDAGGILERDIRDDKTSYRSLVGIINRRKMAARMAALELFVSAPRSDSDVCSAQIVRPALRASIERYIDRHLQGPLRLFTDDCRNAYPLRRLSLLTHRYSGLSRRFKPQTHDARRLASQQFKTGHGQECGGS
jgi:hypothetical protein